MRGKRIARPDLWRFERWIESKATSSTSVFSTSRTGPKRPTRVVAHEPVEPFQLLVGEAEIGLADRQQLAAALLRPAAERVIRIIRGALAAAARRVHQHAIGDERIALPFVPQAGACGRRHRGCRGASASRPSIEASRAPARIASSASKSSASISAERSKRSGSSRGTKASSRLAPLDQRQARADPRARRTRCRRAGRRRDSRRASSPRRSCGRAAAGAR